MKSSLLLPRSLRPGSRAALLPNPQRRCLRLQSILLAQLDDSVTARKSACRDRRSQYCRPTSTRPVATLSGTARTLSDKFHEDYPPLWLRDHCPCHECMHPDTKQRVLNTFQIPRDIVLSEIKADTKADTSGVHITWSNDGHCSFYPWDWLENHRPFERYSDLVKTDSRVNWTTVKPSEPHTFPTTDYNDIMDSEAGVGRWTHQIRRFGFSFVTDCPPTPSATEALLNRIAFIRPTHYGAFWDFTSSVNPTDTAYTTLALPVHTDTTYFTDPCGLQLFHMLSHTDGSGGESTLVDGFAAATRLYQTNPDFYRVLSTCKIVSHASGNKQVGSIDNSTLDRGFPVFQHRTSSNVGQERDLSPNHLTQVRWNNDDRAATTQWKDRETMDLWYAAAGKWTEILQSPEFEIRVQLVPGKPLIFDNWRMLHGRTAFTGKRRVCGGYIGMDDFMARWRMLNTSNGEKGKD